MIEQTQAHADYTAASTKFRLVMLELEKQRGRLAVLSANGTAATSTSIDMKVVRRFVELATHYSRERKIFQVLLNSYHPLVDARFEAAERYERAQLLAEFGIVLASLAVLLSSKRVWILSVVLALCCVGQLAITAVRTNHEVEKSEGRLAKGEEQFKDFRVRYPSEDDDKVTLEAVDPGGVIRKADDERAANAKPSEKPSSE
jgi:hypothetical protein